MAELPKPLNDLAAQIDRAVESQTDKPRPHLGCSIAGHHCERWLWLSFRWAVREQFSGRMLRLFRRGQREEEIIVSDLKRVGIKIGGDQTRVDFGCHVSGSVDGIIDSGVPGAMQKRHVAEFKTHSKKSFDDLCKNGVQKSKPMHWAQMQLYMMGLQIDRALYVAVCKDDDRYYTERVKMDQEAAQAILERAQRIALSDRMPPPISTDKTWYQCKFCPAHDFCFESKLTKQVNCRTCAHSTATDKSDFHCAKWDAVIPYEHQITGCDAHVLHPDMVPWDLVPDESTEFVAAYRVDGKVLLNGEGHFASSELIAGREACADEIVQLIRERFDAKVIE